MMVVMVLFEIARTIAFPTRNGGGMKPAIIAIAGYFCRLMYECVTFEADCLESRVVVFPSKLT
ncbi:MAG: hypothetical protein EOO06_12395 [Chitinophagaceae bacterium]|nr:MAG: hypothetical protein EOO06_12395 [Chitinophagaceae bacterium]